MKTVDLLIGIVLISCVTDSLAQSVGLQVRTQIVQQMVADREIEASCVRQEGVSKVASVSILQLNRDAKPEFLIIGSGCGCQGARRCMQWIYRQNGSVFDMIFEAHPAEEIRPLKTFTNGYRNFFVSGWSGQDICSSTYKFNGRRYKEVESSFQCETVR